MINRIPVDFMAISAHPDDMEIVAGGTLLRLKSLKRSGVLVDITDGGAGTRGTAVMRAKEAAKASAQLGMPRLCLGEKDGEVQNTLAAQFKLIAAIRRFRPRVLITHYMRDEHPDHEQTAQLVHDASFRAGLAKINCEGEPWRPKRIFHAIASDAQVPSFCVDVTDFWQQKMKLIYCYASQVHHAQSKHYSGKTDLSQPAFLEALEVRARYFGMRIRRSYAEAFWCSELAEVSDMTVLGEDRFPSTKSGKRL